MLKNFIKALGQAAVLAVFFLVIAACYSSGSSVEDAPAIHYSESDHALNPLVPNDSIPISDFAAK